MAISLYASTMIMAAGIAIMQPSLPPMVRAWLPARIGLATAIDTDGMLVGETLAVAMTIPPMSSGGRQAGAELCGMARRWC